MMTSNYSDQVYLERSVDQTIWNLTLKLLDTGARTSWVSLKTAPGRGNSWLLSHLYSKVSSKTKEVAFGDIQKVMIHRHSHDYPPTGRHSPLIMELVEIYEANRKKFWRRSAIWVRNIRPKQRLTTLALIVVCFAIGCVVMGFSEYVKLPENPSWKSTSFWSKFLFEFTMNHWLEFPVWLITQHIAGALLTLVCTLAALTLGLSARYRASRSSFSSAESLNLTDELIKQFEEPEGLATLLEEICRGYRGVMFLIDDAQWLTANEKHLLIELLAPQSATRLKKFAEQKRVLIITLESHDVIWPGRPDSKLQEVIIPSFNSIELHDIVSKQWSEEDYDILVGDKRQQPNEDVRQRLIDEKRQHLLELAERHGVKILFEHRQEKLDREMGDHFFSFYKNDFSRDFSQAKMMIYQAVGNAQAVEDKAISLRRRDLVQSQLVGQTYAVEKEDLLVWVQSLDEHLQDFKLRGPADSRGLVDNFIAQSTLLRQEGRKHYFDQERCQALLRWLEWRKRPEDRTKEWEKHQEDYHPLLAQAHYYWFRSVYNRIKNTELKSSQIHQLLLAQPGDLKLAVWHAIQIGALRGNAPNVLQRAEGLPVEKKQERICEIVFAFLTAAALYRAEGNMRMANYLILEAMDWLDGSDQSQRDVLLEEVADQLWRNYWLSGQAEALESLSGLARKYSALTLQPSWRIHKRFKKLLQGRKTLPEPPGDLSQVKADLCNLHFLVETMLEIRQRSGLLEAGLRDQAIRVHAPLAAVNDTIAESHLHQLQVAACSVRGDVKSLTAALKLWRERIEETKPIAGHLGSLTLHTYSRARYWHLLLGVIQSDDWLMRILRLTGETSGGVSFKNPFLWDELGEVAQRKVEDRLDDLARDACLTPAPKTISIGDFIWQEACAAYEKTLQLAALLGWRTIVMEVCYHYGVFLQGFTPKEDQTQSPPWWEKWDQYFEQAIQLEYDFRWIIYAPTMHRIRWKFIGTLDRERSLEDAYNALQSAKRARYPIELILDWHRQASDQFTNHSDSDSDRRRDAELREAWADSLAALPSAIKHYYFHHLPHEQAYSLAFAAQARRHLREYDRSERLLDRADKLLAANPTLDPNAPQDDGKKLRNLKISLRLQRAWLYQAQGRKEKYRQAVQELWLMITREDEDCALILHDNVLIELDQGRSMDESWPQIADRPQPSPDPENKELSLPTKWFGRRSPLRIRTRFEFRFYQLLSLVISGTSFTAADLKISARYHWPSAVESSGAMSINRFGEIGIEFAKLGLQHKLSPETREAIINLLDALRFYFHEIQEVNRHELDALRTLLLYEPSSANYRAEYVAVLYESEQLQVHELRACRSGGRMDWFAFAQKVTHHLSVLVNTTRLSQVIEMELKHSGTAHEDFLRRMEQRAEALRRAQAIYKSGDYEGCLRLVHPVLPPEITPWVFLEDLQALDLWLRCASNSSLSQTADVNRRAKQLRNATLKYISQFKLTIEEKDIQILATKLLNALDTI